MNPHEHSLIGAKMILAAVLQPLKPYWVELTSINCFGWGALFAMSWSEWDSVVKIFLSATTIVTTIGIFSMAVSKYRREMRIMDRADDDRKKRTPKVPPGGLVMATCLVLLGVGCSYQGNREKVQEGKLGRVMSELQEASRQNTTAIVEVLAQNPVTNTHTQVAFEFAKQDQAIEGLPVKRIDVAQFLTGAAKAIDDLKHMLSDQSRLIVERSELQAELDKTRSRLVELGKKYEEEKNRSIVKRFWRWATASFGLIGGIAFIVLCPAIAIPILTRVLGWLVEKLPALASFLGVVSVKLVDSIVRGLERAKGKSSDDAVAQVETNLSREMDKPHKDVIKARKRVLAPVLMAARA